MDKWFVSVGLSLCIDYEDIEAESKEEAERIAKDRALEDIDWNNCNADEEETVYSSWKQDEEQTS